MLFAFHLEIKKATFHFPMFKQCLSECFCKRSKYQNNKESCWIFWNLLDPQISQMFQTIIIPQHRCQRVIKIKVFYQKKPLKLVWLCAGIRIIIIIITVGTILMIITIWSLITCRVFWNLLDDQISLVHDQSRAVSTQDFSLLKEYRDKLIQRRIWWWRFWWYFHSFCHFFPSSEYVVLSKTSGYMCWLLL